MLFWFFTLVLGMILPMACIPAKTATTPVTVVFRDDFKDGLLDGWSMEHLWSLEADGWAVKPLWFIEDDGDNLVLHSQVDAGDRAVVSVRRPPARYFTFRDFTVQFRVKLLEGRVSLLFRHYTDESWRRSNDGLRHGFYEITLGTDAIHLSKERDGTRASLANEKADLRDAQWHTLTVIGDGATLTIRLDESTIITYEDKDRPILAGGVSFENSGHIHLDDVSIWLNIPSSNAVTWYSTGTMPAGEVWAISFAPSDPNIVYLATRMNGAFHSKDGGLTWALRELGGHIFAPVAVHPDNPDIVYASDGVVHRSDDGGRTRISSNLKSSAFVQSIAISKADTDIVYAADRDRTIYKTQNGGRNWEPVSILPGEPAVGTLLIHPRHPGRLFVAVRDAGIYTSSDGGVSWDRILSISPTDQSLIMHPTYPDRLYVTDGETIYRTTDGGRTWAPLKSSPNTLYLAIAATDPSRLYLSGADGVYRSDDDGENWLPTNYDGDVFGRFPVLAVSPTNANLVYAATEHGVVLSTDGGTSWNWSNDGLTDYDAWQLAASPGDAEHLYVGTFCTRGLFETTDAGVTWDWIHQHFHYVMEIAVASQAPEIIYVTHHDGLFQSIDGGHTWRHVADTGRYHLHGLAVDLQDSNVVYVGSTGGTGEASAPYATIYKTRDGGVSWTEINNGFPRTATSVQAIAIDPTNSDTVYVATYREGLSHTEGSGIGIYKSTDGGQSWRPVNQGLATPNVASLAVDPFNPQTLYAGTDRGLFVTTSGGKRWTMMSNAPKVLINAIVLDETLPGTLYITTEQAGVFRTADRGKSWVSLNNGLPLLPLGDLILDIANRVLYAAVRGGYVTTPDGGVYKGVLTR